MLWTEDDIGTEISYDSVPLGLLASNVSPYAKELVELIPRLEKLFYIKLIIVAILIFIIIFFKIKNKKSKNRAQSAT